MKKIIVFGLLAGLLLSACKAKKKVTTTASDVKEESVSFLVDRIIGNQIDAKWFSAKARIIPEGFGIGMALSANVRMHKDNAIWMNVSKLGLEAGRALIRPDSVFILDRLNRTYYARPLKYVESEFNLPPDFELLQEMILGNAVLLNVENIRLKKLTDRFVLSGSTDDYQTEYRLGNTPYLLEEMSINDNTNQRNFSIDFDEYEKIGQDNFAHRRYIELNSAQTGAGSLKVTFSRVELNVPKSMPFSVSSRYKRG